MNPSRNFTAICAVALLFLCTACNQQTNTTPSPSQPAAVKLGFIVKQPEEPWFQLEWKFADQAAAKDGCELVKIGAADGEKVLAAIDNLAAGSAQGFVICTPDTRLGPAIISRAKSHNLKVIAVDDQFLGPDGKPMTNVHYLGISARKIGQMVGQALFDEMKRRNWPLDDTAVCVVSFDELDTARERTDGAVDALKTAGFPEAKMFQAAQRTSDIPGAFDAVNVLLTKHPEVKHWLICGMNDSAVLGAVRAAEGRGFNAATVIGIGINGTDCIPEFEKPTPTGFFESVLLAPKRHGFETTDMLYHWIKDGAEPPLDTRTTGILISRDNYQSVLKDQGIR
jgi:L-arabinose transport system substrate-binding protein